MDIRDRTALRKAAAQRLKQPGWFKLFALHTAVSLGAGLLVSLIGLLLDAQTSGGSGLAAMDSRATWQNLQSLLENAVTIMLPFWEIGLLFLSLQFARQSYVNKGTLLQGFRRLWPVVKLTAVKLLLMMAAAVAISQVLMIFMSAMPQMEELSQQLTPMLESTQQIDLDAVTAVLLETMLPLVIIIAVLYMCLWLVISFRIRLADYMIISGETDRAFFAVRSSLRLTRRKCMALLRLDLSFWWLYLLDGFVLAVAYLEWILPALGIALPMDALTFSWTTYGTYLLLRLVVDSFLKPRRHVTYALVYDALAHPENE